MGGPWLGPGRALYDVLELVADESTHAFELAAAGINIGFCGAQLKSDGTDVYAVASADPCAPADTLCVAASDGRTPSAGCAGAGLPAFVLAPLGRVASAASGGGAWPASAYPGGGANTVVLDGTPADSLHFGPMAPAPGAGRF